MNEPTSAIEREAMVDLLTELMTAGLQAAGQPAFPREEAEKIVGDAPDDDLEPDQINPSPHEKALTIKRDKLGRRDCRDNGKKVKCPEEAEAGTASKPAKKREKPQESAKQSRVSSVYSSGDKKPAGDAKVSKPNKSKPEVTPFKGNTADLPNTDKSREIIEAAGLEQLMDSGAAMHREQQKLVSRAVQSLRSSNTSLAEVVLIRKELQDFLGTEKYPVNPDGVRLLTDGLVDKAESLGFNFRTPNDMEQAAGLITTMRGLEETQRKRHSKDRVQQIQRLRQSLEKYGIKSEDDYHKIPDEKPSTVRQAQDAATKLGDARTEEIVGTGGLSGATEQKLRQLISEASDNPEPPAVAPSPFARKPEPKEEEKPVTEPTTPQFYEGMHFHAGARQDMAAFFSSRGRKARGTAKKRESAGPRDKPAWLRGRGAIVWQADGPYLVVHGTHTREGDRGYVSHMVMVPVEPEGTPADREAERKYLSELLSSRAVGADDLRDRVTHDAETQRIQHRLAELKD